MNDLLDRSRHTTAAAHGCGIVLLLATIVILYGLLYPFQYYEGNYPDGPLVYPITTWRDWDDSRDPLPNILLYLPLGFFASCAFPWRWPRAVRVLIATLAGAALASGIEIAQFTGMGLPIGTLLTAAMLLITSVAESWLPDRSVEITDAIMALALGIAFAVLPEAEQQTAATAQSLQATASERVRR